MATKIQPHRLRIAAGLTLAIGATWLAPTMAASSDTWDRLAQCESGKRWDANTGNGYYGGLQFSAGTWLAYGGAQFAPKAHRATRTQQIRVAERLLADRGWGPWPACSTKLRLRAADALGNPFPAASPAASPAPTPAPKPTPSPTPAPATPTPTVTPTPKPPAATPPTAAALAAARKKATNTAARYVKKQAEADLAHDKLGRAIRKARLAPPEQQASRAQTIQRLQGEATIAAQKAAIARAGADRAARKLQALRAAL